MKKLFHIKMTTTRIIVLGFLIGILLGAFLLWLPVSSKAGQDISFVDALFVATTSLCVTGLTPVVMAEQWNYFGQTVILFLMQFGGLGVITFTTTVLLMLGKRITLKERMLIQDSYNLDSIAGVVKLTKRIIKGTLLVEACGAVMYAFVFIPQYGIADGLWKSVFHAVSAFCNAGLDLVGSSSLAVYRTNVLMNLTTMLLIIFGGLGFPVWWDVLDVLKKAKRKEILWRDVLAKLNVHSKLVLVMTTALVFGGGFLIFLFEYKNPETIGDLAFGNKVMAALFESVTLRTAGFQTIPQENLTEASTLLALMLMFIGGSPSGTAGGVKTVTMVILVLSMLAAVRGTDEVRAFRRKISDNYVRRAVAVIVVFFVALMAVTMALSITENGSFLDILFEATSATATVGLTRGFTGSLTVAGKWVIIMAMYLGRLGPITMALAFNAKKYEGKKTYAEGRVIIG
ncbi:MAG: potassium transporter KtrB [Lachnospiraceae bacterium]|nr:potassium transporter KtrB [Lachnospiraceae bacterium]